jgi:hypothetical protein
MCIVALCKPLLAERAFFTTLTAMYRPRFMAFTFTLLGSSSEGFRKTVPYDEDHIATLTYLYDLHLG